MENSFTKEKHGKMEVYIKTREFGIFTVVADTTNPTIYDFNLKNKNKNKLSWKISVKISDNESGYPTTEEK